MPRMAKRVVPSAPGIPALEPVKQDLYDTKAYNPAAAPNVLEFFRNPTPGELFSNMSASGQLPHPQQFHTYGIAVEMFPEYDADADEGADDNWVVSKKKIREAAWLKFHIGAKDYLTIPLVRVPEGTGEAGLAAGLVAVGASFLTQGIPDIAHYYDVIIKLKGQAQPIHIPSQQAFFVQIYWPTSPTLLVTFVVKVRVYLVGVLWREVQ